MYNSSIIIATHMSYNYFPCVKGRSINNIRKYLPIFRATLITVCCLCSYICTVVLEAGNRVCIQFVFFAPIERSRWPPCPLIAWDIFDSSTETTEHNSTKHDRKQDLNVLYQIRVYGGRSEKQDCRLGISLVETFSISLLKSLIENQRNFASLYKEDYLQIFKCVSFWLHGCCG